MGVRGVIFIQIIELLIVAILPLFLFSKISGYRLTVAEFFLCFLVRLGISTAFVFANLFVDIEILYYLYFPVYMVLVSYLLSKSVNRTVVIFWGLFPTTLWNLIYRSLAFFVLPIFGITVQILDDAFWGLVINLSSTLLALLFFKWLKYDFSKLRFKNIDNRDLKILYFTNWMMVLYFIMVQILTYLEYEKLVSTSALRELLIFTYLILFMGVVSRLDRHLQDRLQETLNFHQNLQLEGMKKYSRHIEDLYKEVRGFRHDYSNLLTTLKWGIEEENLPQIKEVYESVLKDSNKQLRNNKYDVGRLVNVKNSALKSILAAKFIEASEQNISVSLEIPDEIDPKGVELVDFITIVSVLCDNAIEASQETDNPTIKMAYLQLADKQLFVIENSIQDESIDISDIFNFGISTKGETRGIGLYNVMRIIERYPHTSLQTTSQNRIFSQSFEISL